jgi:hypothetical protein
MELWLARFDLGGERGAKERGEEERWVIHATHLIEGGASTVGSASENDVGANMDEVESPLRRQI